MVKIIADTISYDTELKACPIVVVDFYADWCGPCKMIAPEIEKLEQKYLSMSEADPTMPKAVSFIKVNVDSAPELAGKMGVSAMPTFVVYYKGEQKQIIVGAQIVKIKNLIAQFFSTVQEERLVTA